MKTYLREMILTEGEYQATIENEVFILSSKEDFAKFMFKRGKKSRLPSSQDDIDWYIRWANTQLDRFCENGRLFWVSGKLCVAEKL